MPVKLLVIDNSERDCLLIQNTLSGCDILFAGDRHEAINKLASNSDIDIIILDINLDNDEAFKLLDMLITGRLAVKARVIILTYSGEPEKEIAGLKAGASDYIRKPLNIENLQVRVEINIQIINMQREITKRKDIERALEESERSKSVLLSNLPGMAYRCSYDREWTMHFVSEGCFELTGYTSEDLLENRALSFNDLIAPEYRQTVWEKWRVILGQRKHFKGEYEIETADGTRKWVLEIGQGIFDENNNVTALEGIIIDITDRKEKELKLKLISEFDKTTNLQNHLYLENLLQSDKALNDYTKRALILLNLKRLNSISLTYGYNFAERVLKNIASKLSPLAGEQRLLLKISFERFAFYIENYKDIDEIKDFIREISAALRKIQIMYTIGCGIGIVEFTGSDVDTALKSALTAAEKAENGQPIEYRFFDKELEAEALKNAQIKEALVNILDGEDSDRIYLQYQPILDLRTDRISGFETLVRLESEKLGLVSPSDFIPLAEETQIIVPLGKNIMRMACAFKKRLETMGFADISLSINVSATQIVREAFVKDYAGILREYGVDPAFFGFEITESIFADNYNLINEKLGYFLNMGMKVSVDDFGTGYSSLSREREMKINCMKIDRSFIDNLLRVKPEDAITGDIISMAHKLGHCVIAEGVENELQKEYLIAHKCDMLQGFLYSRPLYEEEAIEFVKQYKTI